MLAGVALALSELPEAFVELHGLGGRVHDRGGEREVQFLARDPERVLPVVAGGRLWLLRWGTRRDESRVLPCSRWTRRETLEAGLWGELAPAAVVIPATLGLDRGVWYRIREGVRAVAVRDERGVPVVYPVVEPSTHYYQVMTRSEWMPSLVGELI